MSGIPRQWRDRPNVQPDYPVQINWQNEFARNLIFASYVTADDASRPPYNYMAGHARGVSSNVIARGGGNLIGDSVMWNGAYGPGNLGMSGVYPAAKIYAAPYFNGSTSIAYVDFNMSSYNSIGMSFWAKRESNEVGKIGIDYAASSGWVNSDSTWGFSINAVNNATTSTSALWFRQEGPGDYADICGNGVNPPTVGTWYHFIMNLDQTTTSWGGNGLSSNLGVGTNVNGLFGNFVGSGSGILSNFVSGGRISFGARQGLTAPSNISICNFMMWNKFITRAEARRLYVDGTWQMFTPRTSTFRAWPLIYTPPPDDPPDDPPEDPPPSGTGGGLPEPRPDHQEPWEIVCPVCGFRYPWRDFIARWDNLWVCKHGCWEPRNELDFPRKHKERPAFKHFNPEAMIDRGTTYVVDPTPLYCDPYRRQAMANIGIADCARAGIQL